MLNLIKIILITAFSILIGILLNPIYIVLKTTQKCNWKQIKKVYKLWLD